MINPGTYGPQDDSITRRRWEAEELIKNVTYKLAGLEIVMEGRDLKTRRIKDVGGREIAGVINEEGAYALSTILLGAVNPSVALSNVEDKDSRQVFYNVYMSAMQSCVLNDREWGIKDLAAQNMIKSALQPLLFNQLMRAANGFEAKNSKPQTSVTEVVNRSDAGGGFKLPGFGGKA